MSYTTTEQVRRHVLDSAPVTDSTIEQPFTLGATEWTSFHRGPVKSDSVRVAARRSDPPTRISAAFTGDLLSLPAVGICRDSVMVASDSSLGIEFIENVDYTVDYVSAAIVRKAGGAIAAGQSVSVWYRPRFEYAIDSDYQLDSEGSRLKRLTSGTIGDGETVLVSYEPQQSSFPDDVIAQATDEANQFISAAIDPAKEFGADAHLALTATYHAVALICRIAATRDLIGGAGSNTLASAWLKLAETHQQLSRELIDSFRPPATRPNQPRAV